MSLTTAEYAAMRGVSEQRVRELARVGKIAARREGRSWRIEELAPHKPVSRRPLSPSSQRAVVKYLDSLSVRHVHGNERKRLTERLRSLQASENPAALLREYFAGSDIQGYGGAALVRAALRGKDQQVRDSISILPRRALINRDAVADALVTTRSIIGLNPEQAAAQAEVPIQLYRRLEAAKPVQNGNLYAAKAFAAFGVIPSIVNTAERQEART